MNTLTKTSKLVLAVMVMGACVTGCNRQADTGDVSTAKNTDATTTASSARSSKSSTDTARNDYGPNAADTSGSGSSGTSATSGESKAGHVISDSVITTKVKTALLADSDIKGLDISVDTTNGEVKLTGAAANQTQIDRAEKIARNIDGVKGVQNQVTIKKS